MGYVTLADYRVDVQSALGDRGIPNPRLDRWINYGYLHLATAIDFQILINDASVNTVVSQNFVTVPTGSSKVLLTKTVVADNLLGWVPKAEYFRRPVLPTGTPAVWTEHNGKILLNPVPSAILALLVVYRKPPAIFTVTTQASVLPDEWDTAIFQLAVHHALLALGEEQRAAVLCSV
jgi:hypothetical protein